MATNVEKAASASNYVYPRAFVPFTGGLIVFVYAFFWPEGYGHWLGTIVHAFRVTAGF